MLSTGQLGQLACIWEATARKPGNVHPGRDFHDVTYVDFLASAVAIAPALDRAGQQPLGETILHAIQATQTMVGSNTNLGIVLLLAPLAAVAESTNLREGVERVLAGTTVADAELVYRAIRLASPGGLGEVAEQDVQRPPTQTLREVMTLAAERDLIARQYANGYREVFADAVPGLKAALTRSACLEEAIILAFVELLARHPDTLIARKQGIEVAEEASRRARAVLELGWPEPSGRQAFQDLDDWLGDPDHARNPGTTADLMAASLFVCLRDGTMTLPCPIPWTR
ncbi:MAG: triphosphoribosyl-dephospho-CoA synthase [Gemmataceae bacterium]